MTMKRLGVHAVGLFAGFFCAGCTLFPHTPDVVLERNLRQNYGDFQRLADLAAANRDLVWIGVDPERSPRVVAPRLAPRTAQSSQEQDWTEYRQLLKKTGCFSLNRPYADRAVFFNYSSRGLIPSGSVKGYAYFFRSPPPQESGWFRSWGPGYRFKKVSDDWYLFCSDC